MKNPTMAILPFRLGCLCIAIRVFNPTSNTLVTVNMIFMNIMLTGTSVPEMSPPMGLIFLFKTMHRRSEIDTLNNMCTKNSNITERIIIWNDQHRNTSKGPWHTLFRLWYRYHKEHISKSLCSRFEWITVNVNNTKNYDNRCFAWWYENGHWILHPKSARWNKKYH